MGLNGARCFILSATTMFAGVASLAIYSAVQCAHKFYPLFQHVDLGTFPISLVPFIMSVIFSVIFVISSVYGLFALSNNIRVRKGFLICVIIISLITLSVLILCFIYHRKLPQRAVDYLRTSIENYNTTRDKVDFIQLLFDCCGVEGPDDWSRLPYGIPLSCCRGANITVCKHPVPDGCGEKIKSIDQKFYVLAVSVGCVFLVFTIASAIATCYLLKTQPHFYGTYYPI